MRLRLSNETYADLCAALALVFGTESMIVFRDVLGLDEATARRVKSRAVRALIRDALDTAAPVPGSTRSDSPPGEGV